MPGKPTFAYRIGVCGLATVGIAAWWCIGSGRGIGLTRWILICSAGAVALIPPVARWTEWALQKVRHPSPTTLRRAAWSIAIVSALYFVLTAFNQDRDLFPKTHDDCSYAIGTQMMARGRLWMKPLPLPDFFDSFYLLVRPVYCSLYFPGTALLYAPSVWLHLPTWVLPAIASGAVVGLMYRITAELIDGTAGALAALLTVSLSWFRVYSVLLTSHVAMLLLALLMVWAWMRWRESGRLRWALILGAVMGWGAITRPADAAVYALAIALVEGSAAIGKLASWTSRAEGVSRGTQVTPETRPSRAGRGVQLLAVVAAAAPFLLLQIVFDRGVTHHAFLPPYQYYLERDQPGSGYGFHRYDPAVKPISTLPEKRDNYEKWVRPYLEAHTPGHLATLWGTKYLPMVVDTTMPCRALLIVLPVGLLGLGTAKRWAIWLTLPLFLVAYALNPFFLEHYAIVVIPAVVIGIFLAFQVLTSTWPRWSREMTASFVAMLVMACVTSLWEVNRWITTPATRISDETYTSLYMATANRNLWKYVDEPAVVLFAYHSGGDFFQEPVYNTDVAWPDDAPIVRAHDLGRERNQEIFDYYASIQPDRTFYLFDASRGADFLTRLGTARELGRCR